MKRISVAEQALAAPKWRVKTEGMYTIDPESGCWEWTGPLSEDGYGRVTVWIDRRNRTTGAHRAVWVVHRGPVAPDLHLDHLCRNHKCVNPSHLEPVTPGENTRRGVRDGGFIVTPELNRKRNAWRQPLHERGCGKHDKSALHWWVNKDGYTVWTCRICARERQREYQARKRLDQPNVSEVHSRHGSNGNWN